jgi:S1-C subfamily serine protease
MQFFIDIAVAALTAYLAFTNTIADTILSYLPTEEEEIIAEETTPSESTPNLLSLPSLFESGSRPDILLRNATYQQATAIAALDSDSTYVTNPEEALVNIFCTFTSATTIRTTTGTGFFVHDDGVILTNAHVAQYLLLGATEVLGDAECIVRQGTPAMPQFKAELLYIPPAWVQENAKLINVEAPMGTGERDYALLYITESVTEKPLPESFPALEVATELLPRSIKDAAVTAAGYPATDLLQNGPNSDLLSVAAPTTISELYTFGSNYADVFSIRGSKVGAEGSSGGPVVNAEGKVIGMIATRGDDTTDGQGSLRAITLSHIHRTILEETGFSLEKNMNGDLSYRSTVFTDTLAPFLTSLLSQEIKNN